jgi:hypothetical protein
VDTLTLIHPRNKRMAASGLNTEKLSKKIKVMTVFGDTKHKID